MRSALTPSEQKLWEAIRGCRLGVWFRRQVPLGRYIADFVAPSVRLVVEVDGRYHARRRVADARRERDLGRMGYRVLRVEAALVERHLDEAVGRVQAALTP
jgi:very-short-patch-repair endonuclease